MLSLISARVARQSLAGATQTSRLLAAQMAPRRAHSTSSAAPDAATVNVTYVSATGEEFPVVGKVGENLLTLAHANDIDLEGACECSCACSTCHVIVHPAFYDKIPEPTDEENDMLDLAFGLQETSRLGCQVQLTPELEGIRLLLPVATRNMAVDGFKPTPH
ncbi:ferredoxin, 2Fe-2S [Fonticula alba]|uniref:Ferredoxin, 2Fe-2S n=1 Tax=Fonticula alba TaxID=691883 RepID=A0A058ZAF2_FONAL|nr:ferredoxin, 2Fe-2S [Fonticula alba]KCV71339.1 ferredoxin, 2Fe-2S [Fonticula alba]|eukprot:XP_009494462.1 ferredoxin, 2Fe-2S [Fonticula alba]